MVDSAIFHFVLYQCEICLNTGSPESQFDLS